MFQHDKYWWKSESGKRVTYEDWIRKNYPTKQSCINKCNVAVNDMTNCFSNLTVQVGYANGRLHCWCKDDDGNIIDPTALQFDGDIDYTLVADRFLSNDEFDRATGAIYLSNLEYV